VWTHAGGLVSLSEKTLCCQLLSFSWKMLVHKTFFWGKKGVYFTMLSVTRLQSWMLKITDKFERNWKEAVTAYYSSIYLVAQIKTMTNLSLDSWQSSSDLNKEHPNMSQECHCCVTSYTRHFLQSVLCTWFLSTQRKIPNEYVSTFKYMLLTLLQ
jgi:hypothetical protein